jgi:hypothetical protein
MVQTNTDPTYHPLDLQDTVDDNLYDKIFSTSI